MNLKEYLSKIHDDKEKLSALKAAAEAGKDKEFLAAEGVELPEELSDDALSAVAGGSDPGGGIRYEAYKYDSRGNETHWKVTNVIDNTYQIFHYECKKCGRIVHKGTLNLYYCDPCDEWYWSPKEKIDEEGSI